MKNTMAQFCFIILMITGLHAMKLKHSASIKGKVVQENRVRNIWAVKGNDSTWVGSKDGFFTVPVTPGTWKIVIHTSGRHPAYKVLDHIQISEGKDKDLGKINLN
jgi:hypothetical protein